MRILRSASRLLFWVYVLTVVGAGLWGLVGARLDFPILMRQQVGGLSPHAGANVLSQYRFLRGIEAGFGLTAIRYRKEILSGSDPQSTLFLSTMGLGLAGRLVSWAVDGTPRAVMLVFAFVELAGWLSIAAATRSPSPDRPGSPATSVRRPPSGPPGPGLIARRQP